MQIGTTVTQFIIEEQRRIDDATGDFTSLINDIVIACKAISNAVNYGNLAGILGSADTENVQGETQKKLDVIANDLFLKSNSWGGHVAAMASEEMEDIYLLPEQYPRGKYLLLFDPLDGSTNIDVNGPVGTIFSILKRPKGANGQPAVEEFLQPGSAQVCAGYAIYGPSSMIVMTTGNGVNGFTLDPLVGEYVLTHENMTIPPVSSRFFINASLDYLWDKQLRRYVEDCMRGAEGVGGRVFDLRWSACAVHGRSLRAL